MRKPKPNRVLPRDGEVVEIQLKNGRWVKAVFRESAAVFTGQTIVGGDVCPTGYAIRDHFEYKIKKGIVRVPSVVRITGDAIPRPLPPWRPLDWGGQNGDREKPR